MFFLMIFLSYLCQEWISLAKLFSQDPAECEASCEIISESNCLAIIHVIEKRVRNCNSEAILRVMMHIYDTVFTMIQ